MKERGVEEKKCFDFVKESIFYKDGEPIREPFHEKTYFEASDEEFERHHIFFINDNVHNIYFGLRKEDRIEFETLLRLAHENPRKSEFPDFIFPNGFIEHFKITSSHVNRKGAEHQRLEQQFIERVDRESKQLKEEWNTTPSFDEVRSSRWIFDNPQHSHENLIKSFRYTWNHHVDSMQKYSGHKEIGIFMVEYSECALAMCENVYEDWIDGMSCGDMRQQEKFREYRLSRDRKILEFIYTYKDDIQYTIFVNHNRCEIIRVDSIPYLLKLIPWEYVCRPMKTTHVSSLYNVSVPALSTSKVENTDK